MKLKTPIKWMLFVLLILGVLYYRTNYSRQDTGEWKVISTKTGCSFGPTIPVPDPKTITLMRGCSDVNDVVNNCQPSDTKPLVITIPFVVSEKFDMPFSAKVPWAKYVIFCNQDTQFIIQLPKEASSIAGYISLRLIKDDPLTYIMTMDSRVTEYSTYGESDVKEPAPILSGDLDFFGCDEIPIAKLTSSLPIRDSNKSIDKDINTAWAPYGDIGYVQLELTSVTTAKFIWYSNVDIKNISIQTSSDSIKWNTLPLGDLLVKRIISSWYVYAYMNDMPDVKYIKINFGTLNSPIEYKFYEFRVIHCTSSASPTPTSTDTSSPTPTDTNSPTPTATSTPNPWNFTAIIQAIIWIISLGILIYIIYRFVFRPGGIRK
jgi:hypothetical protein